MVRATVRLDTVQGLLAGGDPSLQTLLFVQEQLVHLCTGRRVTGGFARLVSRQRAVQVRGAAPTVCPAGVAAVDVVGRVGLRHAACSVVSSLVAGATILRELTACPLNPTHGTVMESTTPAINHRTLLGAVGPLSGGAALSLMHAPAAGGVLTGVGPVLC